MALDDVSALIRDLRKVPKDARKGLRVEIRKKGQKVLNRAKLNASWSTRIPKATRLSVKFGKSNTGVTITTFGSRAPHAIHYENEGRPGKFRHPRFGDRRHWYTQAARPYLAPALDAEGQDAVLGIVRVVDSALWNAQFR